MHSSEWLTYVNLRSRLFCPTMLNVTSILSAIFHQPLGATTKLTLMLARNDLSSKVLIDLALSIPALLAGSVLGILAFRNANESTFRRIILTVLLVSGVLLVV
jgi:uncharacterized membrane protein YfcA